MLKWEVDYFKYNSIKLLEEKIFKNFSLKVFVFILKLVYQRLYLTWLDVNLVQNKV